MQTTDLHQVCKGDLVQNRQPFQHMMRKHWAGICRGGNYFDLYTKIDLKQITDVNVKRKLT